MLGASVASEYKFGCIPKKDGYIEFVGIMKGCKKKLRIPITTIAATIFLFIGTVAVTKNNKNKSSRS